MGITEQLLKFARADVPVAAEQMMRLSMFDWAACGIAGAREAEFAPFILAQLGPGPALVIGGGTASVAGAALANGTLSHALDYDDTHFGHIGHPSVAVVPAVLALADKAGSDLATVIEAATIGVEASVHVGQWLGRSHYQIGHHQTATAGAFGATLAACRLLDLTDEMRRHALGLCASMASGLKAQFGTMAKPLNAGLAARTGVEAALWAQSGMTAAHDGLAGPLGFGATHQGEANSGEIGQGTWRITTISHKFHACCHGLHAMLETLAEADVKAQDLAQIKITTHPRWMTVCNITEPHTGLAAKFSYAQTAAMAVLGHDTGAIASFTDAITQDAQVMDLRGRVLVNTDAELSETQARLELRLKNGETRHLFHDLMAPLSMADRAAKLQRKAASLLGNDRAAALWLAAQGADLAGFRNQLVRS